MAHGGGIARSKVPDGFNAVEGITTDAAVTSDANGTLSAKLRGLVKILADVWDSTNHLLHQNVKQLGGTAVDTNSGTKSAGTQRMVLATDQPALTNALKVDGSAVTQPVAGVAASGASVSGNPVLQGGRGSTANPTAVTDGQAVAALFDKLGKQVVVGAVRDLKGQQQTTITSSTSETTIATAVASTFLDLYGLILTNTSATGTKVTIKDSTAGTTRAVIWVPANDTRGFMLDPSAGLNQATVNTAWTATCGTSVASVEITALFVKNL